MLRVWLEVIGICIIMVSVAAVIALVAAPGNAQITLRVTTWVADQSEMDIYHVWIEEYENRHPGINVEFVTMVGSYADNIKVQTVAGTAPDLIRVMGIDLPEWAQAGILQPIRPDWLSEIDLDEMLPAVVEAGTFRGEFYGWDPHLSAYALHYDVHAFDAAGLEYPTADTTWEDLLDLARKLTRNQGDASTTRWGYMPNYWELERLWMSHVWSQGGEVFDEDATTPLFPSEPTIAAAEWLRSVVVSGVAPDVPQDPRSAFFNQTAAVISDGIWMNPYFSQAPGLTHRTAPLPRARQSASIAIPVLWGISGVTEHPREAWELLKFWVGKENSLQFTDFGGPRAYGVPVWRSALDDPRWAPEPNLMTMIDMATYTRSQPAFVGASEWYREASRILREITLSEKPSTSGLIELAERFNVATNR